MEFETVIGLEVHVELKTDTKIFSPSPNAFGSEPNENINPKDLGYPGTLPVLNEEAVNFGMKASMALNCDIADEMIFEDRKSTRLNSSHVSISYAVFCLKKKNNKT